MAIAGYIAVWAVLAVATGLELLVIGRPIPQVPSSLVVMGLAGLKAILIALFYQHLIHEARSIPVLYLAAALTGVGLLIGMAVSIF